MQLGMSASHDEQTLVVRGEENEGVGQTDTVSQDKERSEPLDPWEVLKGLRGASEWWVFPDSLEEEKKEESDIDRLRAMISIDPVPSPEEVAAFLRHVDQRTVIARNPPALDLARNVYHRAWSSQFPQKDQHELLDLLGKGLFAVVENSASAKADTLQEVWERLGRPGGISPYSWSWDQARDSTIYDETGKLIKAAFRRDRGEAIHAEAQHRFERAKEKLSHVSGLGGIEDMSSLGAAEGMILSQIRMDPDVHARYQDTLCEPGLREKFDKVLRTHLQATHQDADEQERVWNAMTTPSPKLAALDVGGRKKGRVLRYDYTGSFRKAASALEGLPDDIPGRLFVRISIGSDERVNPALLWYPLSKAYMEALHRTGIQSMVFWYELPWDDSRLDLPAELLERIRTRRHVEVRGLRIPLLGPRFRSLTRKGRNPKGEDARNWRQVRDVLTRVAEYVLYPASHAEKRREWEAGGRKRNDAQPPSFGTNRWSQFYGAFIKSPLTSLQGYMGAAVQQRTLPNAGYPKDIREALEGKPGTTPEARRAAARIRDIRAGKIHPVQVTDLRKDRNGDVQLVEARQNPWGTKIQFAGLRSILDQEMERPDDVAGRSRRYKTRQQDIPRDREERDNGAWTRMKGRGWGKTWFRTLIKPDGNDTGKSLQLPRNGQQGACDPEMISGPGVNVSSSKRAIGTGIRRRSRALHRSRDGTKAYARCSQAKNVAATRGALSRWWKVMRGVRESNGEGDQNSIQKQREAYKVIAKGLGSAGQDDAINRTLASIGQARRVWRLLDLSRQDDEGDQRPVGEYEETRRAVSSS